MKKLIVFLIASLILTPAFAVAQGTGINASIRGEVKADMHASSTRPMPHKLGPAIKNLASTTRAEWKGSASTTRAAVKAKIDAMHALIDSHKATMKERAEAARAKAKENFGERIEKLVGQVSNRLASSSAKLSALALRIDARIEAHEAAGHDMSASSELLATAQADLADANNKITAVNQALADAMSVGTTTAKAAMPSVRAAVKAAQDALSLAKEDLQKTLRSIKVDAGVTASTTTTI